MDKADFIRIAPAYYELAVILEVVDRTGYFSESTLKAAYETRDSYGRQYGLLQNRALLRAVITKLAQNKVISILTDPFGPTLYAPADGLSQYIELLENDRDSPFLRSSYAEDRREWVVTALSNLFEKSRELDVSEDDFAVSPEAEWAPIPIDRGNESFIRAETAVNETISEVEKSNGYNAQHPEERASVLDHLRALRERLRTAKEISVGYVKAHGVEPLRKLSARFGDALIGRLAASAIDALLGWLGFK